MARTVLIMCIAAAGLAAKDRAWQTGQLLNNTRNPYFTTVPVSNDNGGLSSSSGSTFGAADNGALVAKPRTAEGNLAYDDYVIAGDDTVYLVEYAHFKTFPSANVSLSKPVTFAIEKNKLIIRDLDRREFETTILKQADKRGGSAPANTEQAKIAPPKPDKPKPQSAKPDVFATAALSSDDINPPKAKPAPPAPPPPAVKPAPKPEPKVQAAVTKPQRPRPEGPVVRATTKDRAWQSGQLLSVADNNFFFNVTYSSDAEGSTWPFSQGSDGRYTVTGQIAAQTANPYTYDNYVIESQFVAYLVQRMRPKTSPTVRFPGTKPLKFAVDKGKMWVLDEQGIEYETKVVKLIQKDAIVDPLTRVSAAR